MWKFVKSKNIKFLTEIKEKKENFNHIRVSVIKLLRDPFK